MVRFYSPIPNNSPLRLLIFGFFIRPLPLSYLDPPTYKFFRFCFADISEIVKTDCSTKL